MNKFISLALSKDDSRPNLQAPYRTRSWIVATDGNRMHAITGLPEISDADSHWTTGQDLGQYPTVSMFLDAVPNPVVQISLVKQEVKNRLKIFQAILKAHKTSDVCCRFKCTDNGDLTLKYSMEYGECKSCIEIALPCEKLSDFPAFELWVNGQYLLDALLNMGTTANAPKLRICPTGNAVGALYLECQNELAVIMPMQDPNK